jgi:hypothetical protein
VARKIQEPTKESDFKIEEKTYEVKIVGTRPIIFNRDTLLEIETETKKEDAQELAKKKESLRDKEDRIWRTRAYSNSEGKLFIPSDNIHESLKEGCKYWGQKIPGERNKTYTDPITSAVLCTDIALEHPEERFVDIADLKPFIKTVNINDSKIIKIRPMLTSWQGTFFLESIDARLTLSVLKTVITFAGAYKGICDWRQKYGRYKLAWIRAREEY